MLPVIGFVSSIKLFEVSENFEQLEDAREVVQWYQYQIAVKTMRALSGRKEELEEDPEIVNFLGILTDLPRWR